MNKKQFVILISIQIVIFILILLFINFRTPPREDREPPRLNNKEQEILNVIYPKLALYIPNLYEYYFEGIGYKENKDIFINLSNYCHLRKLGCYDACLLITINKDYKIMEISGCDMPTVPFQDSLDITQINKLKRNIYNEMYKK